MCKMFFVLSILNQISFTSLSSSSLSPFNKVVYLCTTFPSISYRRVCCTDSTANHCNRTSMDWTACLTPFNRRSCILREPCQPSCLPATEIDWLVPWPAQWTTTRKLLLSVCSGSRTPSLFNRTPIFRMPWTMPSHCSANGKNSQNNTSNLFSNQFDGTRMKSIISKRWWWKLFKMQNKFSSFVVYCGTKNWSVLLWFDFEYCSY